MIVNQFKIYVYGEMYIVDEYDDGIFNCLSYNVTENSLNEIRAKLKEIIEN